MDKTTKQPPTKEQIDALAALYVDAKANVDHAQTVLVTFRDQLEEMVADFGTVPRRATKSKRIEGDEFQVTLSNGHSVEVSVEVNAGAVMKLAAALREKGLSHLFRKLFKRETVFVLAEGAQEYERNSLAFAVSSRLRLLFANSVEIKDNSPALKVEPKDEKKKEKEERERGGSGVNGLGNAILAVLLADGGTGMTASEIRAELGHAVTRDSVAEELRRLRDLQMTSWLHCIPEPLAAITEKGKDHLRALVASGMLAASGEDLGDVDDAIQREIPKVVA